VNANIAIKVDHVSKDFVLPHEKTTSIKSAFTGMLNQNRTKESQHALKDISFEVKKGEFFGIVGRNGSGKSTMLKILASIYQPTKGKIHTYGKLVPFIELGVGFNAELTGRENVYLNGAMLGFSHKEVEAMYDDIVAFAELERFMDQKLKNYSSGMQVRLAFSMATRSEADILLVDEVLAVGDADFQRKCFDYFKALKRNKKTVVFVSHDMSAIREYCDRAVLIEDSEMVASGSANQVATKYTRMFMDKAADALRSETAERWGDGKAAIKSVVLPSKKLSDKNQALQIQLVVEANQALEDINVGYSVTNGMGQIVAGTNTKIQNRRIDRLSVGESVKVIFEVPNIFTDGSYSVNVAVVSPNGVVHDWWDNATQFRSYEETSAGFLASPETNLTIEKV